MREDELHYVDGQEIHVGDRVLFGGHPARIVAVIGRSEYAEDMVADDWREYERGVLMRTDDGHLYMHEFLDEDVKLVARGVEAP